MRLQVVVSTSGKAALERCGRAYAATIPKDVGVNVAVCGWREGLLAGEFDYVHLTGDEYEPHTGWLEDAVATIRAGMIPAPVLWDADGEPDGGRLLPDWEAVEATGLPFLSRGQVGRLGPLEDWIGFDWWIGQAALLGVGFASRERYAFTRYPLVRSLG